MRGGKRGGQAEDLDLVPIMNLVTILIPFLLMASQFVSLAVIDSTLPAIGAPPEETTEPEETLNLTVAITDEGFTVAGSDAVLQSEVAEGEEPEPTIPCPNSLCSSVADYDVKELTRLLSDIKERWQDEENVILVPEASVEYEVLVATMDAAREDPETKVGDKAASLFPFVVIAGGVQ
jgi:biopolymer transport protein ExbD